jgi:site-specific recombinase XerD
MRTAEDDDAHRAQGIGKPAGRRQRKLHAGHFAFMRAVVQGIDARASWERYLRIEGDAGDRRAVRSTIQWMRDEFAAAARREHRHGTARLVLIDVSTLADEAPALPGLEAYARERGIEDFSHAEQLQAYEAEFGGATQRQSRRGRLVAQQLEALRWLEQLVAQPPQAGDAVASWLAPQLAGHLEAAGIGTLAQLVDRINGVGRRWSSSIKAVGVGKAERIVEWLRDHEATIGTAIGAHVALARRALYAHELDGVVAQASAIRPLEKFVVPAELDGSRGAYRRPQAQCLLQATNDYEALLSWIGSKHGLTPAQRAEAKKRRRSRDGGIDGPLDWLGTLSHTQRAYRKEGERFLLWAVIERGKALSSMTAEDCGAYREFLADPLPKARWCAQRNRERWSPLWRPFEGPLSPAAQRHAVTILKSLYAYLVDHNYLMGNPWAGVGVPKSAAPRVNAGRSFTRAQWRFVLQQLETRGDSSVERRLAVALELLYATGLRLSEAVAARVDDLQKVDYPPDRDDDQALEGWVLGVVGKGMRQREVPVPDAFVARLGAYLASRGLGADVESPANRGACLLGKASDMADRAPQLARAGFDAKDGIAANTLYDQVKRFFADCATLLRETKGDARGAARFEQASTHWLRHTHASHSIASGTPVEIAQQNLGHASLATTTVYVTTEKKRRMRAMAEFWKG